MSKNHKVYLSLLGLVGGGAVAIIGAFTFPILMSVGIGVAIVSTLIGLLLTV